MNTRLDALRSSGHRPGRSLLDVVEGRQVQLAVAALIVANAITLGLETVAPVRAALGPWLEYLDSVFLTLFVVELSLRIVAHGRRFFGSAWNIFDLAVIAISLLPSAGPLSVLRTLRVLRVLRIVSIAPSMRRVVGGLLRALPGLASISGIMVLVFYVAAVIATQLYGPTFPQWFGSLGRTAYSLFQVMTLESWSMGIVRPVMEQHPMAWLFFILFILVTTFTMLNVFIAVIVSAMQKGHAESKEALKDAADERVEILDEIMALRREVSLLRARLPGGNQKQTGA